MKIRQIVYIIICISFLSSPAGLGFAQATQPPVEGPGAFLNNVPASLAEPQEPITGIANSPPASPRYDSGWVSLAQNQVKTLTHNLQGNPDHYVVDMQYWADSVDGINQRYYGGADFGTNPAPGHLVDDRVGAYWRSLTATTITVFRRLQDTYAEKVRVRIWVDATPDWDSGWVPLLLENATTLIHNLGGNTDDYVVDMQYRSGGSGVSQRYYGGMDIGANAGAGHSPDDRVGTYWRTLTDTSITVFRRAEDDYSSEVRLRIWLRPVASYDSGWVSINPGEVRTLSHNLSGNAGNYLVDVQYKSGDNGINLRYYGGMDFGANPPAGSSENDRVGAYWRSLTNSSIVIYRRPEDIYAEQIRVRIWDVSPQVYLPLVRR